MFERNGLLGNKLQAPRADSLLKRTQTRQREVGDELYEDYSNQRLKLIEYLIRGDGKSQDEAIHIAQKILDRIIFVAFCEDRALLPEKLTHRAYTQLPAFSKVTNPRWQNFKNLFGLIDRGDESHGIPEFDGGLCRKDSAVDDLELPDEWTHSFLSVLITESVCSFSLFIGRCYRELNPEFRGNIHVDSGVRRPADRGPFGRTRHEFSTRAGLWLPRRCWRT